MKGEKCDSENGTDYLHTCPFALEINNDDSECCNCCPDCEYECCMCI